MAESWVRQWYVRTHSFPWSRPPWCTHYCQCSTQTDAQKHTLHVTYIPSQCSQKLHYKHITVKHVWIPINNNHSALCNVASLKWSSQSELSTTVPTKYTKHHDHRYIWKMCSERCKHRALAVVRWSQKLLPHCRPPPGGAGWPKFNQLEMVTTFTYRPSLVKIDACNFELSW